MVFQCLRWLVTAFSRTGIRVRSQTSHCGLLLDKLLMGQVILRVFFGFFFPQVVSFQDWPILHYFSPALSLSSDSYVQWHIFYRDVSFFQKVLCMQHVSWNMDRCGTVVHLFRSLTAHSISYTLHVSAYCLCFVVCVCNGTVCFTIGSELAIPSYFPPQVIVCFSDGHW